MKPIYQLLFSLAFLLLILPAATAQNDYAYLEVLDPQIPWSRSQGVIEDLVITVYPRGLYAEVGFYMTVSGRSAGFLDGVNLEAILNFSLPKDAVVNDSWLWIDSTIIQAEMIDRWTASSIYEEIVGRNQDPSILFKNSERDYQLRIFPMASDSTRRIKMNFLLPGEWSADQVIFRLPAHLVRASHLEPGRIQLRYFSSGRENWGAPRLQSASGTEFTLQTEPGLGTFYQADLPWNINDLSLALTPPFQQGVYLDTLRHNGESFYQLALLPTEILDLQEEAGKNYLVLLHHNDGSDTYPSERVLQALQTQLQKTLGPADRFNIMWNGVNPMLAADDWIAPDPEAIQTAFDRLYAIPFNSYNLTGLLLNGLTYLNDRDETDAEIILVANSGGQEGNLDVANPLLDDLILLMDDRLVPFHIFDYRQDNVLYHVINNRSYRGNEYLYDNLSRLTGGSFFPLFTCCVTLEEKMAELFQEAFALPATLDLYTTLQDGFCYNRFTLSGESERINLRKPVLQIGKFRGAFPFIIEAGGEVNGEVFLSALSIGESLTAQADTLLATMWAAQYIRRLSLEPATNSLVAEIIDRSIQDRVLTRYTALICLEPELGGEPCPECIDQSGGDIVGVTDPLADSLVMDVFPNPFREQLQLTLTVPPSLDLAGHTLSVLNSLGQVVYTFDLTASGARERIEWNWNGIDRSGNAVATGLYFIQLSGPKLNKSVKVMKW